MAKTYGPTGEGVKPTLGVDATMGESLAKPGGAQKISVGAPGDIPKFAGPATKDAGDRKPPPAGTAPDFAKPGGPQGWTHGKK
jgi:hypothetical protein